MASAENLGCHLRPVRDFPLPVAGNNVAVSQVGDGEVLDPVEHFSDESRCVAIVDNFRQQRDAGLFQDITIIADGIRITAHRSFLAAFSRYFESLISSPMMESAMTEVPMNDVNGPELKRIIDFAYSGQLEITPDNVQVLLELSNYLGIDIVCNACTDYLLKRLTVENVVEMLEKALAYDLLKLKKMSLRFAVENFEQLETTASFHDLSPDMLMELLADDDVMILKNGLYCSDSQQEQHVLETVLHYTAAKEADRRPVLRDLLAKAVRLNLVEPAALEETVARFPQFADEVRFTAALGQVHTPRSAGLQYEISRIVANTPVLVPERITDSFDDSQLPENRLRYVVGMKIFVRRWDGRPVIGGLLVMYSTGEKILRGGDRFESGDVHEFYLKPEERIIRVKVACGWMLDRLTFLTNQNRWLGAYGGPGGGENEFRPTKPGAFLAGFRGRVDYAQDEPSIRHFAAVWAHRQRKGSQ